MRRQEKQESRAVGTPPASLLLAARLMTSRGLSSRRPRAPIGSTATHLRGFLSSRRRLCRHEAAPKASANQAGIGDVKGNPSARFPAPARHAATSKRSRQESAEREELPAAARPRARQPRGRARARAGGQAGGSVPARPPHPPGRHFIRVSEAPCRPPLFLLCLPFQENQSANTGDCKSPASWLRSGQARLDEEAKGGMESVQRLHLRTNQPTRTHLGSVNGIVWWEMNPICFQLQGKEDICDVCT